MPTNGSFITDAKEEKIVDTSIVYVKAHGTTTTSERDCTVRTAGLDPDPIGDSGTFLVVGTVAPTLLSPITHQTVGGASLEGFWSNQGDYSHKLSFYVIPTHQRSASNWNHSNWSSDERDVDFTNWVFSNLPDLDIHALIGGLRLNQEELGYKSTWSRILIHQERTESWFHLISGSEFGAMYFTTQWTCFGLKPATRPKIVLPSPPQQLYRPRTTWRIFMGLSRIQQAKDPTNWPLDHQGGPNILKQVDLVPFMATPRSNRSKSLSTRVWRPGDIIRHLIEFLDASLHDLRCTTPHLIKWIKFELHLPYLAPFAINLQQLYSLKYGHKMDLYHINQHVSRHSTFPPKLSRIKGVDQLP